MKRGLGTLRMSPYCTRSSDLPEKICQYTMNRVGAIVISKSRELMMKHVPKEIDIFTMEQSRKSYSTSLILILLFFILFFCLYFHWSPYTFFLSFLLSPFFFSFPYKIVRGAYNNCSSKHEELQSHIIAELYNEWYKNIKFPLRFNMQYES
jgi:hypothetical protein